LWHILYTKDSPLTKLSMSSMINLILFGPPGSGKGTQADSLAARYGILHISTGDLFRAAINNKTALGMEAKAYMDKGNLVPDAVTIGMLYEAIKQNPNAKGVLLDGFPRTIPQAEALDAFFASKNQSVTQLIALQVDDEELVRRLVGRGQHSGRPDDANPSIIRNRLETYKAQTTPVADYYKQQNKTQYVNGEGSVADITERLFAVIDAVV
jgi:adenylate kinase